MPHTSTLNEMKSSIPGAGAKHGDRWTCNLRRRLAQ